MKKVWIITISVVLGLCLVLALLYVLVGCGVFRKAGNSPLNGAWLELPAVHKVAEGDYCHTHWARMQGRQQRNFTCYYDPDTYTSSWVAYPLCTSHTASDRDESWGYDPLLPEHRQTSVSRGYGASEPTVNYPENFYARGHQLPNADRSAVPQMMQQTYYSTNMTPQLQNGFNGGIWKNLEEAVRCAIPHNDTLYIVTGASFTKGGAEEPVKMIVNRNDGKSLPVPNYYWKVVMKVRRLEGKPVEACAVGFWMPHSDLKGHDYAEFAVSVDQIEDWTGFDFYVHLEDSLEKKAEAQSDWESFRRF